MRWLPAALLAAGLILGVALPLAGAGRLPFLVGVACLAAAGIATRRTSLALAGLAAAVLLFLVPGFVSGRRNEEGIAWTAPEGERVVFAEAGLAVTEEDAGRRITGRDLDTGARRWGLGLAEGVRGDVEVRRVGRTLLVSDRAGTLRALDLATGKQRWDAPAVDGLSLPAVATPELVAVTRCRDAQGCTAEVRSVADGAVRWRAPVASDPWLGSPPIAQSLDTDRSLWPASAVILRLPPEGDRYEVRRLAAGEIVARGKTRSEALAVVGNLFLREAGERVLTATDITTGDLVWRRAAADRLRAARTPDGSLRWLGLPDGGLILTSGLTNTEDLPVTDMLRVLDPRTGKLTEHAVGELYSNIARAVPADGPEITTETTAGPAPRVPVLWNPLDKKVAAGGHVFRTGTLLPRAVAATPTQVGWNPRVHAFASGDRRGAVVYDRRTGKRLVRFVGERRPLIRSEGERIVIAASGRDHIVKP